MINLFSQDFLSNYADFSPRMNDLGAFVYLRTYSRYLPEKKRREVWKETVKRAVEFNIMQEWEHCNRIGMPITKQRKERMKEEAIEFFESMYNLNQFLSGRTMWAGDYNNKGIQKFAMANFNCAYTKISKWDDLGDLFYALLVGTGAGFGCRLEDAKQLPPIRNKGYQLNFEPYEYVGHPGLKDESFIVEGERAVTIVIGDSKEGWVKSLNLFFEALTNPRYKTKEFIRLNFNYIRPNGTPLKTFGGTASGPEPLREMFEGIYKTIRNELDSENLEPLEVDSSNTQYVHVRPIHIMDIANLIGYNVVVGGVRRTAEIFLLDPHDYESVFAKFGLNGLWTEEHYNKFLEIERAVLQAQIPYPRVRFEKMKIDYKTKGFYEGTGLHHRRMSNNSVAFIDKPNREYVMMLCDMMQLEGEPGMINLYEAARRILKAQGVKRPDHESIVTIAQEIGVNPCAEIILFSKGLCNLTTINVKNFVHEVKSYKGSRYVLDREGLIKAQRLSARAGLRMTLIQLELPEWHRVQSMTRLTGCSMTGYQDAMEMLGWDQSQQDELLDVLKKVSHSAVEQYADELRIPIPLFVTTIKPEGTLSQVAGGVSPGLHFSHAPYHIRRIRINSKDPLALAVRDSGWTINPEVGTSGADYYEQMSNARTWVVDFPVATGSKRTKEDVSALEQFEIYRHFQRNYTDMNTSNTITVKPDEWRELFEKIFHNWDEYVGVSFLALDGGTYQLAPYETISKNEFEDMSSIHKPLRLDMLARYDVELYSDQLDEIMEGCENGACPIR
jgi:adenosylcobalamin-dependent ribonucleoside-triphosphate reductase